MVLFDSSLSLGCSRWNFQTNPFSPHPVRGIKLLSERTLFLLFESNSWLIPNNALVSEVGKLVCHVFNSNIAIDSLPTLQISLEMIPLFEKIYDGKPFLTVVSNIGDDYNTVVSMTGIIWKVCRIPTQCRYLETIIDFKWQKQASRSSFRSLSGWACTYVTQWPAPICLKISAWI